MNPVADAATSRKTYYTATDTDTDTDTDIDATLVRFARRHRLPARAAAVVAELAGIGPRSEARNG